MLWVQSEFQKKGCWFSCLLNFSHQEVLLLTVKEQMQPADFSQVGNLGVLHVLLEFS